MPLNFAQPPAWRRYLRFWGSDPAADVDAELRFHIESRVAELLAQGMTDAEARRLTQLRFGDLEAIRQHCHQLSTASERERARSQWYADVRQDLRFALRQLLSTPAFSLVAALTIALGIGANSAIFSVLNAVLLRPLPFDQGERVMRLNERWAGNYMESAVGQYLDWRAQSRSFQEMGATYSGSFTLTGQGDAVQLNGAFATASFFRAAALPPLFGRYYTDDEDRAGAARVVVLSEKSWRSRFNAERSILGRTVLLNGQQHTVVGVAPQAYALTPDAPELYVPAAFTNTQIAGRDNHYLNVLGLLAAGVTPAAAEQ